MFAPQCRQNVCPPSAAFAAHAQQANLALYINAVTFLVSAITIFSLREIPKRRRQVSVPSMLKQIVAGYAKGIMSATIKPGSVSPSDAQALVEYIKTLK